MFFSNKISKLSNHCEFRGCTFVLLKKSNEKADELKLNFSMAKMTSIPSSNPLIRKEHRSHIGTSDPKCQVLEEASSTLGAKPLLANFSPERQSFFPIYTFFTPLMKTTLAHMHTEYPKKSNNPFSKPPLHILCSQLISYTSAQATFFNKTETIV